MVTSTGKNVTELISDLRKVPVIRAVVPFITGILITPDLGTLNGAFLRGTVIVVLICLLSLPWLDKLRQVWGMTAGGVLLAIALMLLGSMHHNASRMFRVEEGRLDQQEGYLEGIVVDGAVRKNKSWLLRLEGKAFMNDTVRLRLDEYVQVYLPADAEIPDLLPGEHLLVRGRLDRIRNYGNPGEFDYAGYMYRKRTRYQMFVRDTGLFRVLDERETGPGYRPARLRQRIIRGWDREDPDVAVLSALTLGYKSLLDQETKSAFSDAGAMHLLAVSGLHVGMIWWILEKLIRVPGGRSAWRRLKLILIVGVLWGYAAVTGFSDSVTRSVTMFSLLTLSRSMQRNSNIYNTLLLSAFLLLLLKPSRIMEPGFQLSYIAVAGIVTIQPQLEKIYAGVHWSLRRILDLMSVSIAAQVSTLPLVLTYFHQFPVWFMLTNLTAIPLVSVILAMFVLFIPFLIFFPEWELFSQLLLWATGILNKVVAGIASLPGAVITDVMPDPAAMWILLGILISACMFVYYKRAHFLAILILLLSIAIVLPVLRNLQLAGNSSITIFNMNKVTLISHLQGPYRETCLFPADSTRDYYLQAYVQSLSGSPPGVRSHRIVRLSETDSLKDSSPYRITDGLWGIRAGTWNILIAGDCDRKIFQQTVRSFNWQMVVFRRGAPLYGVGEFLVAFNGRVVGDGTLRPYEMNLLRQQIPSVWLTGTDGALVVHK